MKYKPIAELLDFLKKKKFFFKLILNKTNRSRVFYIFEYSFRYFYLFFCIFEWS